MKAQATSIWRGIAYSLIFHTAMWIVFLIFMHTPIWDSGYAMLGCLGIYFLVGIPFYFIFKNDCNALYLLFASVTLLILSLTFFPLKQFMELFLPYKIFKLFYPHYYGWDSLVYVIPMFAIPFFGALPIVIDGILYLVKWIWKALGNRKSI